MEYRESNVVEVRADRREVVGLAVPYNQVTDIRTSNGIYKESFAPNAIADDVDVPVYLGHDHVSGGIAVGTVTEARNAEDGLHIVTRISKTAKGDKVLADVISGKIKSFSVGFNPLEHEIADGVTVRTKVALEEVSLVENPAYQGAVVSEIREQNNKQKVDDEQIMDKETELSNEVSGLRDAVTDLERKLDKFEVKEEGATAAQFRSAGEWVKALADNDSEAKALATRDFATSVDADNIRPAWINDGLKLVEKQRIVKGLFAQRPLGATGNSIEYPYVKSTSGEVAEQATEGANLSYLELAIDTMTAPVKTYGGYSSLSRQAIERSDVDYLEAVLRFQALSYANATEKAVQDALVATAANANEVELGGTAGAASAVQWIEAIIDAKGEIDDNSTLGLSADFILISKDVHKKIALIKDTAGRPVFAVNSDGQNTWGTLPINGRLAGVIDGTPVVVGKNLPAGTVVVASSEALVSREAPGAPFRLQDENIVNLTKDFSLYGYMAISVPDVKAITFIVDEA